MNPDNYGTSINASVRDKDMDDIDTSNMSEEELDEYIERTYGYIDHPEVK